MYKTFNEMISEQSENETLLESVLGRVFSSVPIDTQTSINESASLDCDENGVFPDDDEDDEIDRQLGV